MCVAFRYLRTWLYNSLSYDTHYCERIRRSWQNSTWCSGCGYTVGCFPTQQQVFQDPVLDRAWYYLSSAFWTPENINWYTFDAHHSTQIQVYFPWCAKLWWCFSLQTCLINHHSIVGDLMGEEVIYEGNSPSTPQTCFQTYVHARKTQRAQLLNDTSWWKSTQTAFQ